MDTVLTSLKEDTKEEHIITMKMELLEKIQLKTHTILYS